MAFDQPTRNRLARFVGDARRLVADEFSRQFESLYGISADGTLTPVDQLGHLDEAGRATAERLRERIRYLVHSHPESTKPDTAAVDRLAREQAFTVLNRLAALRMAEKRGLIVESVGRGYQSRGFKVYETVAGTGLGDAYHRYRCYLFCLFDELAVDLGVLFDRRLPSGLLFPREKALLDLLALLNAPELDSLWAEDETIGWIYQYYNDEAERKKMREQSSAPRNSRELAVRNQFFTPRYVVEFLTDNTLGRVWYEMTQGRTSLKEQCRYLVRRPAEIFLPSPKTLFWHDVPGQKALRKFCASGDPVNLPESPELGALFGWLACLTEVPTPYFDGLHGNTLDGLGFAPQLRAVGIDPHALAERWQRFLGGETSAADPAQAQTLELLQLLWLIPAQRASRGDHDWAVIDPVETLPAAAMLWRTVRDRLLNPPAGLSQEELLRQPVLVPFRPAKDPREIRLLDPACGSMHFGLYVFDLFETIYLEAWERGLIPPADYGADSPPLDQPSVRVDRTQTQVHSNDLHHPVDAATARVVMLKSSDPGDGMFHAGPYLTDGKRTFRPGTIWDEPFLEFDFPDALASGQFSLEEGERLVRETPGAWLHNRIDPLPPEEVDAAFRRDIPRLIVEHNIHGIDIDPRAVQIAGLSLWLRAQRAWHQAGVKGADRPRITRSNLVCAEPMPGDKEMLREFVEQQFPVGERPAFGFLLETVFDRMTLAGEAGSLLRIEEEIRTAIADAKQIWKEGPKLEQGSLFAESVEPANQGEMRLDLSGITDEQFWEQAEQRIYDALEAYAGHAEDDGGFQRRLFADDAARGFAFIDLCIKRYDVAVMNPPFGDASLPSKGYIDETYGDTKGDVYKAFVECFHYRLIPSGFLGIISSRTGFFLGQSEDWRTRVVLRLFRPLALADLGIGVLDAMVEVAAYILRNLSEQESRDLTLSLVPVVQQVERDRQDRFSLPKWQAARGGLKRHQAIGELENLEVHGFIQRCAGNTVRYTPFWHAVKTITVLQAPIFPLLVCIRTLGNADKGAVLQQALRDSDHPQKFLSNPANFAVLPGQPFAYWASERLRGVFEEFATFEDGERIVRVGLQTSDDFRFLRDCWEVAPQRRQSRWFPFVKGGKFSPFYGDIHLLVLWEHDGEEMKAWADPLYNNSGWSRIIKSTEHYFRPGLTWPLRAKAFSPQAMPAGCVFSVRGYAVLAPPAELGALLGITASLPFDYIFKMMLGRFGYPEFVVGILQKLPLPAIPEEIARLLAAKARKAWETKHKLDAVHSTSQAFYVPALLHSNATTLVERTEIWAAYVRASDETVSAIQVEIDDLAFRLYGLDATDRAALTSTLATEVVGDINNDADEGEDEEAVTADTFGLTADLSAYTFGAAFGRWDVRYATGERSAPEIPDPFAPLPVCPPGMLQGDDGLPLPPETGRQLRADGRYPLDVAWDGILVDDPEHPFDLERRVQAALAVLWGERADALEHEACTLLGVPSLREWFRRPAGFFADHLKRYSKSRRQAPIYWPLSTASGRYTIWLYYHRFNDQTLHRVIADFLNPKLKSAQQEITDSRESLALGRTHGSGGATRLAELQELHDELTALRTELERIIALPWRPNLNDGVLITASPLWRLFRLGKWQKDLKACWESLSAGEYDWAHLAYTIWPERVRDKCRTDRSLAIAHGLEALCTVEPPKPKAKRKGKAPAPAKPED